MDRVLWPMHLPQPTYPPYNIEKTERECLSPIRLPLPVLAARIPPDVELRENAHVCLRRAKT